MSIAIVKQYFLCYHVDWVHGSDLYSIIIRGWVSTLQSRSKDLQCAYSCSLKAFLAAGIFLCIWNFYAELPWRCQRALGGNVGFVLW